MAAFEMASSKVRWMAKNRSSRGSVSLELGTIVPDHASEIAWLRALVARRRVLEEEDII